MPYWKRALSLLGLGEHAEFIWGIFDFLGLTKPLNWLLYGAGGGVSGYLADIANWSPISIFLAVIGAGAGLSVVYGAWHHTRTIATADNGIQAQADLIKQQRLAAKESRRAASPSIDRIPCTELLKIASASGWDFVSAHSLHLLDLQDAMRQGGADSTLTIWGRAKKWDAEQLMRNEILEKIPADHWKDFFVYLFAALDDDNFNVYSWKSTGSGTGRGYVDLHVERSQAAPWVNRDAVGFKGKTKK